MSKDLLVRLEALASELERHHTLHDTTAVLETIVHAAIRSLRVDEPEWLTVPDVAMRLSVSKAQVKKWMASGQFDEVVNFGDRLRRISAASYERFVEKNRSTAA